MKSLKLNTMKSPLLFQMIQEYLSEYNIAVKVFIYLFLACLVTCAFALVYGVLTLGAPNITLG